MRSSVRLLVLSSAAVVGVAALGSCSPSDDGSSAQQTLGVDRPGYESVGEVADRSIFAFTGVVGEAFDTTLAPTYDSDDPEANPYAGTDGTPSAEEVEAASVPVVEYQVWVVEPLSSPLERDAETAVIVLGGEAYESEIVYPERDEEYLFFVITETQDASYSLVGIDVGAFQAQGDGSYLNPVGMVVEAAEVEAYAERAGTAEG